MRKFLKNLNKAEKAQKEQNAVELNCIHLLPINEWKFEYTITDKLVEKAITGNLGVQSTKKIRNLLEFRATPADSIFIKKWFPGEKNEPKIDDENRKKLKNEFIKNYYKNKYNISKKDLEDNDDIFVSFL